ncbi:hypothetical protein LSAT2_014060 [Lamellibrachia satsuma]|nr:hypothetical protein LSAT2_014060 [Lamellibrachia satsuma]
MRSGWSWCNKRRDDAAYSTTANRGIINIEFSRRRSQQTMIISREINNYAASEHRAGRRRRPRKTADAARTMRRRNLPYSVVSSRRVADDVTMGYSDNFRELAMPECIDDKSPN